jgi:hypothetical protein
MRSISYRRSESYIADLNPVNKIMLCDKEEKFDSAFKAQVDEYQNTKTKRRAAKRDRGMSS